MWRHVVTCFLGVAIAAPPRSTMVQSGEISVGEPQPGVGSFSRND